MKHIQKYSGIFLAIYLAIVLLIVPQMNNPELMNSTQSSKAFGFIWGMLVYVPIALLIGIINSKSIILRITIIDILLGLYSIMVIISYWLHPIDYLEMLTFGALVLFYLSIRFLNPRYYILLLVAVVVSGLIQAIYGNLQLYGVYPSNHGIFRMTGSFFNPGPYAGYLAAILPVSLGFYLYEDTINISDQHPFIRKWLSFYTILTNNINRIPFIFRTFYNKGIGRTTTEEQARILSYSLNSAINFFVLISMVAMCLVLPASRSRASWLAVMVSAGYLLAVKYNLLLYIKSTFITLRKRIILITSIVIILAITGAGMYYFKKDSADGRVLIWKVSTQMIKDKPIFGHGIGKFEADYMNYQAAYFKLNPEAPEAMQADNVTYAYNELLKLTVEKGIIGLILALGMLWVIIIVKINPKEDNNSSLAITRGAMVAIIVFGLFSYPSEILPIKVLFILYAAMFASQQKTSRIFHLLLKETMLLSTLKYATLAMMLFSSYPSGKYLTRHHQTYRTWKDASDIYNVNAYPECLEDFELAYPQLKNNGVFLVQYGKALEMAEKYERSIIILSEAKGHLNNTIVYICFGNCYKALNKNLEAEQAYLHAWNMAPVKFYPLYLLAKLYNDSGQKEKAVVMAKKVMSKKIKIESTAIKEIQEEIEVIIEKI